MRWRPEAPSIYLPNSGQIDLNAIGVEAGQANNSQTALNDAAVRDMIGKGANAQNAMSEYYGASSGDGVTSENFGESYYIGLLGYANQAPSGSIDSAAQGYDEGIMSNGENFLSNKNVVTYSHVWPCSFDGEPHAFTAEHPSAAGNWTEDRTKSNVMSNMTPTFNQRKGNNDLARYNRKTYGASGTSLNINPYGTHDGDHVSPLQRLKPGTYTITGTISDDKTADATSSWSQVTGYIIQFETMTPLSSTIAKAGGNSIQTHLVTKKGSPYRQFPFTTSVNIQYEWCFLHLYAKTNGNPYGYTYQTLYITSIS